MSVNILRKSRIKPEKDLSTEHREYVLDYIKKSVPEKHKIATQRALFGQITRHTAIRVKCLQCCNYDRESVKVCKVYTCALHPIRPYQDTRGENE